MDLDVYTVVKEAKEWTISAGGIRIIACRDRRTAIQTVRRATELLRNDGNSPPPLGHSESQAFGIHGRRPSCAAHARPGGI